MREQQFYKPTPSERFAPSAKVDTVVSSIDVQKSPAARKLTGNLLDAFSNKDNFTQVFNNGDPLESPRSSKNKSAFETTVGNLILDRCADLLDEEGKVKPDSLETWTNVVQIAPKITGVLLSDSNYIGAVNRDKAVDVMAFAIDAARDPDLLGETVISTGFGGSDDEFSSTRLPAYTLPGLGIVRDLSEFYAQREADSVKLAKRNKVYAHLAEQEGVGNQDALPRQRRTELNKLAYEIIDSPDAAEVYGIDPDIIDLSEDEMEELRRKNGIAAKLPTLRFFFADQAAIAINHTMQPDGIRARTADNLAILHEFVTENFPDISDNVQFVEDKPWEKHTFYQQQVIEYCAHLLRTSDDRSIQETLALLERLGGNHGGEAGQERAAEYAAIHPAVFQDRLNLPYSSFLQDVFLNPKVNITIGGQTERSFCAVRDYLTEHASSEGLSEFINQKIKRSDSPDEQAKLSTLNDYIRKWEEVVSAKREKYQIGSHTIAIPDRPYYGIELITDIGRLPTYYAKDGYDTPYGSDINAQIADLEQREPSYTSDDESVRADERTRHNIATRAVVFDLEAVRKAKLRQRTELTA